MTEQPETPFTQAEQLINIFNAFKLPVAHVKKFLDDEINQKIHKVTKVNDEAYKFNDGSFITIYMNHYSTLSATFDMDL